MPSAPVARLARVVLAYLVLMVAIITLAPFRFTATAAPGLTFGWTLRDAVLNIVLFVPIGFVLQLGRARRSEVAWFPALVLGACISAAIEAAQLFMPQRFPSVADLVTNALGAGLGAVIAAAAARRYEAAGTVRAFALDLPLVGLVYLLVPVLWLGGLSSGSGEALLLVLPTAAAAWIIASVHAAYAAEPGTLATRPLVRPVMAGALFIAVTGVPVAPFAPQVIPAAALAFALVVALRLRSPPSLTHERGADGRPSRRFEAPTLRAAMVPLVAFVVLHLLWPLDAPRSAWRGTTALLAPGVEPDERAVFRIMTQVSAFTAIGYAIAEQAGRAAGTLRAIGPRVLAAAAALAVPLELARGARAGSVASASVAGASLLAAGFGAWLFLLQLQHLRALLGRESPQKSSSQSH